ncbi:MAG: hypothetical protein JSR36_15280 [Proteobacteria bacterium]|nr:hypothetical protein [Pseudomonadota bacterium]
MILEIGLRFDLTDIYIVGSAAILATMPDPPEGELTATRDVDVIPPRDEEKLADQISFVLGEASDFEVEHGYYAQGVTSNTPAYAPMDWKSRTIEVRVGGTVGHCMDPNDLVLSKLGAGRPKDLAFAQTAAHLGLIQRKVLLDRLEYVDCSDQVRRLITDRITAAFAA